jgi:ABC-type transport system substrate-binding protein
VDPAFCCDSYFTGYDDPALVALANEAINTADPVQAQPLWDKLQTEVATAAFIVPLYNPQLTYLAGASIEGFEANSFGFYDWAAIGKSS